MLALGNPLHAFDFDDARRRADRRPPRAAGREAAHARRRRARARADDLVIADAERAVALAGIMGGEETEIGDGDDRRPARGRELRAVRRSSAPPSGSALRTEGSNRWEKGVDPYLARAGGRHSRPQLIVELDRRRAGSAHADVHGEPAGAAGRRASGPSAPTRCIGHRDTARASSTRCSAGSASSVDDGERRRPDLARARRDARDRRRRGGRALPARRTSRSRCRCAARCSARCTREQRLRRRVEDVARRARVRRGLHAEPRRRRRRHGCVAAARADLGRARGAAHLAAAEPGRGGAAERRGRRTRGVALFEIARVYLPGGDLPRGALARRRRSSRAASRAPRAWSRRCTRALKAEPHVRARAAPAAPSGQGRRAPRRAGRRRAPSRAARGRVGRVRARPRRALRRRSREPGRRTSDVISYPAVRQDIAFVVAEDVPAGDARRRGARGGRRRAARDPRLRRLPRRAGRRRAEVGRVLGRVPVARADAHRRGRGAPARRGSSRALAERFGAELRA